MYLDARFENVFMILCIGTIDDKSSSKHRLYEITNNLPLFFWKNFRFHPEISPCFFPVLSSNSGNTPPKKTSVISTQLFLRELFEILSST